MLAAYLRSGQTFDFSTHRYSGNAEQLTQLRAASLATTPHPWLDGLKATNAEAYHYWLRAFSRPA